MAPNRKETEAPRLSSWELWQLQDYLLPERRWQEKITQPQPHLLLHTVYFTFTNSLGVSFFLCSGLTHPNLTRICSRVASWTSQLWKQSLEIPPVSCSPSWVSLLLSRIVISPITDWEPEARQEEKLGRLLLQLGSAGRAHFRVWLHPQGCASVRKRWQSINER